LGKHRLGRQGLRRRQCRAERRRDGKLAWRLCPAPQHRQQRTGPLRSFGRILGQEPADDGPRFGRKLRQVWHGPNVFDYDFLIARALEWDSTGQKLVADDAEAVEVGAGVLGPLGRKLGGRAEDGARCGEAS
jgi:hypothetical protein